MKNPYLETIDDSKHKINVRWSTNWRNNITVAVIDRPYMLYEFIPFSWDERMADYGPITEAGSIVI